MKRIYSITFTETDEYGTVFDRCSKKFKIEPPGKLSPSEDDYMKDVPCPSHVIRVNGTLVDANAMTFVPGCEPGVPEWNAHKSISYYLPCLEYKFRVRPPQEPSSLIKKVMEYITLPGDVDECNRMIEFPNEYASDLGLLILSQLPPWNTPKNYCPCPSHLEENVSVFAVACQNCLKRTFLKLWVKNYTKRATA